MADYIAKPGSENSPCIACGKYPKSCRGVRFCVPYQQWINACWAAFNRYKEAHT